MKKRYKYEVLHHVDGMYVAAPSRPAGLTDPNNPALSGGRMALMCGARPNTQYAVFYAVSDAFGLRQVAK